MDRQKIIVGLYRGTVNVTHIPQGIDVEVRDYDLNLPETQDCPLENDENGDEFKAKTFNHPCDDDHQKNA